MHVFRVRERREEAALTVAESRDGSRAYVACELDGAVHAIDVARHAVIAKIPAGEFSNGVAMRPDGARVYVSNGHGVECARRGHRGGQAPLRVAIH